MENFYESMIHPESSSDLQNGFSEFEASEEKSLVRISFAKNTLPLSSEAGGYKVQITGRFMGSKSVMMWGFS